jgi:hypothetical protein
MNNNTNLITIAPSPFKGVKEIEYFDFEEDFVEENMRCIPMIVRFKMDMAGIKLKLSEWSRFSDSEKLELALKSCHADAKENYYNYLSGLIKKNTGNTPTLLSATTVPRTKSWDILPDVVRQQAIDYGWVISASQWSSLTILQRYALLKLCRPGHENRNFPIAFKEFGLVNEEAYTKLQNQPVI